MDTKLFSSPRLQHFARHLWPVLQRQFPELPFHGKPQVLALDVGARNVLLADQRVVLKLRMQGGAPIEPEIAGLRALKPGLGPAFLGQVSLSHLQQEAATQRQMDTLQALDLPLGEGILLQRLTGRTLQPPFSDDVIEQVAGCLVQLHRPTRRKLPPLFLPSRPTTMLRMIEDCLNSLREHHLISAAGYQVLQRALKQASQCVERWERFPDPKVRTLCHGDLRWHNMMQCDNRVVLLDLEHAGRGDPAVDLAMMVCRTPLHWYDELRLLEAYAARCDDPSLIKRFFLLRPVVGLLCALGAILHQAEIAAGFVPLAMEAAEHTRRREEPLLAELSDALERLAIPVAEREKVQITLPGPKQEPQFNGVIAVDGTAASLKSPFCRRLAQALSLPYYNTGTAYRYAALWAWCHQLEPAEPADIKMLQGHLQTAEMRLLSDGSIEVEGERWESCLHLPVVEATVALWAAQPEIREALSPVLKAAVSGGPVVLEGRDVGTVLAPEASLKLYVNARLDTKAGLLAERSGISRSEARQLIQRRDRADRHRSIAPLEYTSDSQLIELAPETFEQQLEHILQQCRADTP